MDNSLPPTYYHLIMASERIQRRIERLLDQIDEAESQGNWESVRAFSQDVLDIDSDNTEAAAYLGSADRRHGAVPATELMPLYRRQPHFGRSQYACYPSH